MAKRNLRDLLSNPGLGLNRGDRRNAMRTLKDEVKRVENMTAAERLSGAGYAADRELRSLLAMCNEERIGGSAEPFSNIWDVFSGFTKDEPTQIADVLRLRPERDHAYSALDFYAFATEEQLREQALPRLKELPEGVIHNYSALGDIREVSFAEEGKPPVVMAGISLVRHGDHLHWIAVGGPVMDLDDLTASRRRLLAEEADRVIAANPAASREQMERTLHPRAVPLEGVKDVWLSFTLGLFNLSTASHEIRTIAHDWESSIAVFSDHFEQRYADRYESNPDIRRMVDKAVAYVEDNRIYIDVAETALALPAYFAAKVSFVAGNVVETGLGASGTDKQKRFALKAPMDMRVLTRTVSTLDFGSSVRGVDQSYAPPRFRVEVDGFWRRLAAGSTGRDAEGHPVVGRTWVRGHARWKDKPPKIGLVHVKSPVGRAMETANAKAAKQGGEVRLTF